MEIALEKTCRPSPCGGTSRLSLAPPALPPRRPPPAPTPRPPPPPLKEPPPRPSVLAQAARLGLDPIQGGVGNVVIGNPLCTSYDSLVRLARQDSWPKWSLWEGGKLQ